MRDGYVYVSCMKSLNAYDCLFLIMIDVKLTPSGLWWTAYLFV